MKSLSFQAEGDAGGGMRFLIHAVALLTLALPARLGAQDPGEAPACRASLDGDQLTTTIEFSDGYAVEAPWQVVWNRSASLEDGSRGVSATAKLDRIVEVRPGSKERVMTPFPEPITTTFEGHSEQELAYRAAQIWCLTVLKAQEQAPNKSGKPAQRTTPVRTVGP
jgi:hypothetical protein